MQERQHDSPRQPPAPPRCPTCGKPMRLATATPETPFINLKRATFVCTCGGTSDALFADKE